MARWCALALAAAAVVVAMMVPFTAALTVHNVGDASGWIPANVYTAWASGKTFTVGDILLFNFTTSAHDVLEVPKRSYDSCSPANAIGQPITAGPANVTLNTNGTHYYICTFTGHCSLGQKLAVNVTAAPGGAPTPAKTPAPSPPPTTPAPSGSATPTPPGTPTEGTTGAPAPGGDNSASSSSRVASLFVSLFTVALGFLFY